MDTENPHNEWWKKTTAEKPGSNTQLPESSKGVEKPRHPIDIEKFKQDNPIALTRGGTFRREHGSIHTDFPFERVIGQAQGVPIEAVTVVDKGEDAIGIEACPDGKISIAVADGVSNSLYGAFASRESVTAALTEMQSEALSAKTLTVVSEELQRYDLQQTAQNTIASLRHDTMDDIVWRAKIDEHLQEGSLAATTLSLLSYDKNTGELDIAVKGDSPIVIFRADGTFQTHRNPNNPQLQYVHSQNFQYHAEDEIIQKATLAEGDVVLACTDGVPLRVFDDINSTLIANRLTQTKATQAGETINTILAHLRIAGVGDDISAVAFEHKNPTLASLAQETSTSSEDIPWWEKTKKDT